MIRIIHIYLLLYTVADNQLPEKQQAREVNDNHDQNMLIRIQRKPKIGRVNFR